MRSFTVPAVGLSICAATAAAIATWLLVPSSPAPPAVVEAPRIARAPRTAVPTPEPPPKVLTREEAIKLVQAGGLRSRFMMDCRARGGRACCGQGGCCGLQETRIARHVSMFLPSVEGELDTAAIEHVIARHGGALDDCYTREAIEPELFSDHVSVELEIASDGSVARGTGSGFDDAVARCAAKVLGTARFPAPRSGTVTASTSLTFR